jgi:hypothetical protein
MAAGKGMAYLLVEKDKNWGKSRTLRALTGGSIRTRWIDIISKKDGSAYKFFIKRTSNTDAPEDFEKFIRADAFRAYMFRGGVGELIPQPYTTPPPFAAGAHC